MAFSGASCGVLILSKRKSLPAATREVDTKPLCDGQTTHVVRYPGHAAVFLAIIQI